MTVRRDTECDRETGRVRQSDRERERERERETEREGRETATASRSRNSLVWRVAPSSQPAVSGAYRQRDGRKIRPVGLGRACVSLGAQCHGPLATLSHNALGFSLSLSLSLSASLFLCVSLPLPASLFHSFLLSLSLRFCPSPVLSVPQLLQYSTALYRTHCKPVSSSIAPSPAICTTL